MDYDAQQSSSSPYEYVGDTRESFFRVKQEALSNYGVLYGWCSLQKADFLMDLILAKKPQTIVEIGVWGGSSLVPMAYALRENQSGIIYGIDPWSNHASTENKVDETHRACLENQDPKAVYCHLVRKIEEFGLKKQIKLIPSRSKDVPEIEAIDLLYIDGNHSEINALFDVQKWVPLVNQGGMIIFNDLNWMENGEYTTKKAVAWLDQHCFKIAEFVDSSIWGVWVKL